MIDPKGCDCPEGYEKKDAGEGKARCIVGKTAAAR